MKTTVSTLVAAASLLGATQAAAQAQPARPAAAPAAAAQAPFPSRPGPAIAGVCVVDNEQALAVSSVGTAFRNRMQALGQQVNAELTPEQTAIETELRNLNAQSATLQPAQRQQRETALRTRAQNHQNLALQRQRELEATQSRQLQRLSTELRPVLDQVYGQRGCGLLIDRTVVVAANPAMDITAAVTQGLNARIQTITFERERIQATPAAPAAR